MKKYSNTNKPDVSLPAGKSKPSGNRTLVITATVLLFGAWHCALHSPAPDPFQKPVSHAQPSPGLCPSAEDVPGSDPTCGNCDLIWSDPDPFYTLIHSETIVQNGKSNFRRSCDHHRRMGFRTENPDCDHGEACVHLCEPAIDGCETHRGIFPGGDAVSLRVSAIE